MLLTCRTKGPDLNRLACFAAVVETVSFAHAAERLGIPSAVVSLQITRMEQEAKASWLLRATRSVSPTELGRDFFRRCNHIVKEAEDAFDRLSHSTDRPTGTLRATVPPDYGVAMLTPVVTAFRRASPSCSAMLKLGTGSAI
ncbi:LysR family transcriptional regulator [Primorskyibacter sp. 2E107]|uniref:LysR family transcriptional regulator n=1 Tax=Primorskyibacter sp. 2E107 TaxID=3403458 RepID=UPI003AF955A8